MDSEPYTVLLSTIYLQDYNKWKMISDVTGLETLQVIAKADKFNKWMYQTIRPYFKGEILEIGSGIGNISKHVIQDNLPITLSDYNPEYCTLLKKKYTSCSNVREIISIDLQDNDFFEKYISLKNKFDTIFLLNVIEHLPDDGKALEFCSFLLKKNGHLIVLAPAYQALFCTIDKELGHFRRYTAKGIKNVLKKKSLVILDSKYFNILGIAGWMLFGKLFKHRSIRENEMNFYNKLVPLAKILDTIFLKKIGLSLIIVAQRN